MLARRFGLDVGGQTEVDDQGPHRGGLRDSCERGAVETGSAPPVARTSAATFQIRVELLDRHWLCRNRLGKFFRRLRRTVDNDERHAGLMQKLAAAARHRRNADERHRSGLVRQ